MVCSVTLDYSVGSRIKNKDQYEKPKDFFMKQQSTCMP